MNPAYAFIIGVVILLASFSGYQCGRAVEIHPRPDWSWIPASMTFGFWLIGLTLLCGGLANMVRISLNLP